MKKQVGYFRFRDAGCLSSLSGKYVFSHAVRDFTSFPRNELL
jgi:hypothetical protein